MKSFLVFICLSWVGYSIAQSEGITDKPKNDQLQSTADNSFDIKLAKYILLKENKNTIISPLSVKILLAMILEATEPGTESEKQLRSIFKDNRTGKDLQAYFKNLLETYSTKTDEYDFRLGSKIYMAPHVHPLPSLLSTVEEYYGAAPEIIDFQNLPHSMEVINGWCSNATNGHVKEMITEEMLMDPDNVMILLNAIFFNGNWENSFEPTKTKSSLFYKTPTDHVETMFMSGKGVYDITWMKNINASLIKLPYMGKRFSMMFLLPREKDGINELIGKIDDEMLELAKLELQPSNLLIDVPKFKFTYETENNDLRDYISEIGIRDIFSPTTAHMSAIGEGVHVTKAKQKAGIEIDEKGSTIYAVTTMVLGTRFGSPLIKLDHPFMFYVIDEITGTIIFIGKVMDPSL